MALHNWNDLSKTAKSIGNWTNECLFCPITLPYKMLGVNIFKAF